MVRTKKMDGNMDWKQIFSVGAVLFGAICIFVIVPYILKKFVADQN